jgi:Domain of unknown function (DUF4386)
MKGTVTPDGARERVMAPEARTADEAQPAARSRQGGTATAPTPRRTGVLVGALFLLATVAYVAGSGLIESVTGDPRYLAIAFPDRHRIFAGMLLELVNCAAVIVAGEEAGFRTAMIALGLGGLLLSHGLYTWRLVPRPLSLLGFVGYALLLVWGVLGILFGKDPSMALFIPGAVFELAFPAWLFLRGLDPSAVSSRRTSPVAAE